jgi:hypothetical protein
MVHVLGFGLSVDDGVSHIEEVHKSSPWHRRDVAHRAGRPPPRGSRRSAVASRAGAAARRQRPSAARHAGGGAPRRVATRSRSVYARSTSGSVLCFAMICALIVLNHIDASRCVVFVRIFS